MLTLKKTITYKYQQHSCHLELFILQSLRTAHDSQTAMFAYIRRLTSDLPQALGYCSL